MSRSHGTKHHPFWPKLGVSRLQAGRSFQIPQICLVCATTSDTLVVAIPQPRMNKILRLLINTTAVYNQAPCMTRLSATLIFDLMNWSSTRTKLNYQCHLSFEGDRKTRIIFVSWNYFNKFSAIIVHHLTWELELSYWEHAICINLSQTPVISQLFWCSIINGEKCKAYRLKKWIRIFKIHQ